MVFDSRACLTFIRSDHPHWPSRHFARALVANHLSAIFAKLQVADRTQAILRARDAGLGHP